MAHYFKTITVLALIIFVAPLSSATAKDAGDIMIRLRGLSVMPDEGGAANDGRVQIGGQTDVDADFVPELDISYFFTKNIAAELILGSTQHDTAVVGSTLGDVDLGSVRLLPPTLTLQYHFLPDGQISPYVGAGINYTHFFDKASGNGNANVAVTDIDYDDSFGAALQVGLDVRINESWSFNMDVKRIFMETDINLNNGLVRVNDADIDPWLIGVGIGYRF